MCLLNMVQIGQYCYVCYFGEDIFPVHILLLHPFPILKLFSKYVFKETWSPFQKYIADIAAHKSKYLFNTK